MDFLDEQLQRVLVAEDDNDDYELFANAIKDLALKIVLTRAENGDVLMQIIHREIPDMLFLDMLMPCKDGMSCLQEIRTDRKFDNLPIVVYTALHDLEAIEFCYRQGTNLYVYKPHSYSELIEVIEKIFAINWKKMSYYPTRSNFVLNSL